MESVKLDIFHAHEALDRVFVLIDSFSEQILKHPFIFQNPELEEQAIELCDKFQLLYNAISREYDKYEDTISE